MKVLKDVLEIPKTILIEFKNAVIICFWMVIITSLYVAFFGTIFALLGFN